MVDARELQPGDRVKLVCLMPEAVRRFAIYLQGGSELVNEVSKEFAEFDIEGLGQGTLLVERDGSLLDRAGRVVVVEERWRVQHG